MSNDESSVIDISSTDDEDGSDFESSDEVSNLRKSVYAAEPDTDDEPIEEAAYSKLTRLSINGFLPTSNSDDSSDESDAIAEEDESDDSDESDYAISDESVEEIKQPTMPTTSQQKGPDVDVQDVQPKYSGKVAMKHFNEQKVATVDKLCQLQIEIDSRPCEDDLETEPKYLKVKLMKHQLHAVKFMLWRESSSPRGGLLADDMGLGKTLTTISLVMKSLQRSKEDGIESNDDEAYEGWVPRGPRILRKGGEFESPAHVAPL